MVYPERLVKALTNSGVGRVGCVAASVAWAVFAGALVGVPGCVSPLSEEVSERGLKRSVIESVRREMTPPGERDTDSIASRQGVGLEGYPPDLREGIERRLDELESLAGPGSYDYSVSKLDMGEDLRGGEPRVLVVSLEDAVRLAVQNNLEVQFARLAPAVNEAQVVQAQAAFDWVFFSNLQFQRTDTPVVNRSSSGFNVGGAVRSSDVTSADVGLRKTLTSGGQIQIQHQYQHLEQQESGLQLTPDPAEQLNLSMQIDQPLLRNFGSRTTLSQVRLSENAERRSVEQLRTDLIRIVLETEREYWNLVRAHRDLMILTRLTERGEELFRQIHARRDLDATPAQVFTAADRVESRKGSVIAARNALRRTSDRLKVLINDPELPLASEVVLLPRESAIDAPIRYNLADAIATAIEHRPEVRQSILSIDDATIRRQVAQNARLPQLDLRLRVQLNALEGDPGRAYTTLADADFIDALVGLFSPAVRVPRRGTGWTCSCITPRAPAPRPDAPPVTTAGTPSISITLPQA